MTEPGPVPGQRRALEVTGVLPEQLRVLRGPSGRLDYRPWLRSQSCRDFLLGMPVLKNCVEDRMVAGRVAPTEFVGACGYRRSRDTDSPA
jgi:hypothetical protein